ncbi:MAG: class I SAM-dependent methyltransferase [Hyphomicrobiaceae bacterium]|nr:class I SAM-dependent methyltransferase [Hyphomicrobiaceae bacterium]
MSIKSSAKSLVRNLLPSGVVDTLRDVRYQVKTVRLSGLDFRLEVPNRRVLEDVILPSLARDPKVRRVLFVGCRWYTKIYAAMFRNSQYWTIEIDPTQAKFGSQDRHIVDSYLNLSRHVEPSSFDAVVLNGVFGWGIDTPADTEVALYETLRALNPGGVAIIGYNATEQNHPAFLDVPSEAMGLFEPFEMEALGGSEYVTPGDPGKHTFVFLRKPYEAA